MYNLDMIKFNYNNKPKIRRKYKNMQTFNNWLVRLTNIATSVFKWENLPETCDPFLLEWSLLVCGKVALYEDDYGNILSLPTADGGMLNVYGYPISAWVYGFNGFNKEFIPFMRGAKLTEENLNSCSGVICYDNNLRYPYFNYVVDSAEKLADITRTIEVTSKTYKTPFIVKCDEKQVPTAKKIVSDIDENEIAIYGTKNMLDGFEVFQTGVKAENLTALWDNFNNTFDVFKEIFGINNNNQSDKKERLITDEVNANNQFIEISIKNRLEQREKFVEIVNEKWGLNISVSLNLEEEVTEYVGENGGFTSEYTNQTDDNTEDTDTNE